MLTPTPTHDRKPPSDTELVRLLRTYDAFIGAANDTKHLPPLPIRAWTTGTARFAIERARTTLEDLDSNYARRLAIDVAAATAFGGQRDRIAAFLDSLPPRRSRLAHAWTVALVLALSQILVLALALPSQLLRLNEALLGASSFAPKDVFEAVRAPLQIEPIYLAAAIASYGVALYVVLRPRASGVTAFRILLGTHHSRWWPPFRERERAQARQIDVRRCEAEVLGVGYKTRSEPRIDLIAKAALTAPFILLAGFALTHYLRGTNSVLTAFQGNFGSNGVVEVKSARSEAAVMGILISWAVLARLRWLGTQALARSSTCRPRVLRLAARAPLGGIFALVIGALIWRSYVRGANITTTSISLSREPVVFSMSHGGAVGAAIIAILLVGYGAVTVRRLLIRVMPRTKRVARWSGWIAVLGAMLVLGLTGGRDQKPPGVRAALPAINPEDLSRGGFSLQIACSELCHLDHIRLEKALHKPSGPPLQWVAPALVKTMTVDVILRRTDEPRIRRSLRIGGPIRLFLAARVVDPEGNAATARVPLIATTRPTDPDCTTSSGRAAIYERGVLSEDASYSNRERLQGSLEVSAVQCPNLDHRGPREMVTLLRSKQDDKTPDAWAAFRYERGRWRPLRLIGGPGEASTYYVREPYAPGSRYASAEYRSAAPFRIRSNPRRVVETVRRLSPTDLDDRRPTGALADRVWQMREHTLTQISGPR